MSTILTTIAQMQAAGLDLDKNTKIEVLNPHIDAAEKNFLLPVLGRTFYEELIADLEETTPSEATTALLPYLQKPLAWNAYYLFFKKPVGSLSHSGFYKKEFEHSKDAAKWEIYNLRDLLIANSDRYLDELIDFLIENYETYESWQSSDFYKNVGGTIIPSATVFNNYVNINSSGMVFKKLRQFRIRAEKSLVRSICKPLYDRVLSEINDELSEPIKNLIEYLRPVVAYDSMSTGIKLLNFNYLESGIYIYSASITEEKTVIKTPEVNILALEYHHEYEESRNELLAFLNDNIADYPEYESSPCYSTEPRTLVVKYENDPLKKHFGI